MCFNNTLDILVQAAIWNRSAIYCSMSESHIAHTFIRSSPVIFTRRIASCIIQRISRNSLRTVKKYKIRNLRNSKGASTSRGFRRVPKFEGVKGSLNIDQETTKRKSTPDIEVFNYVRRSRSWFHAPMFLSIECDSTVRRLTYLVTKLSNIADKHWDLKARSSKNKTYPRT